MGYAVGAIVWAALTGWAAHDAARRGRSWYVWSRIVFFTGIFGLAWWLVVRRRHPVTTERLGVWRGAMLTLSGVPLVAFGLMATACTTMFLFQFARVQGQAMTPTLQNQERVIVNKMTYRISEPRNGDVVMFFYPIDPNKSFVKRVIAGPGETARIITGRVYVNDVEVQDDAYVPAAFRSHDDWGPQVVPEGYYFLLGDHRNNSSDSRSWRLVPKKYIVGRIATSR